MTKLYRAKHLSEYMINLWNLETGQQLHPCEFSQYILVLLCDTSLVTSPLLQPEEKQLKKERVCFDSLVR